jgi:hypothetical protein
MAKKVKSMQEFVDKLLKKKNILTNLTADSSDESLKDFYDSSFSQQWILLNKRGFDIVLEDVTSKRFGFSAFDYLISIKVISKVNETDWQVVTAAGKIIDIETAKFSGAKHLSLLTAI